MKKIKLAAATVLLALGAMPALAQEAPRPIYVGIALGQAHAKRLCADATVACDERSGATRYFAGYQFHRNFGVEASYTNLERFNTGGTVAGTPVSGNIDGKIGDLVAVAAWPVVRELSVYGKAGLYHASMSGSANVGGSQSDTTGTNNNWTVGAGAQLNAGRFGVRAEFQRFHDVHGGTAGGVRLTPGDIDVWSLGVLVRF